MCVGASGATHYTHCFQPLTGSIAEKHDAWIKASADGELTTSFKGKTLLVRTRCRPHTPSRIVDGGASSHTHLVISIRPRSLMLRRSPTAACEPRTKRAGTTRTSIHGACSYSHDATALDR